MKMEMLQAGGVAILRPQGALIGSPETEELRHTFSNLSNAGNLRAIVDLSKVPYLNSTGIGVLVGACNDFRQRQGKLKLASLNEKHQNLFVITKLTQILEIYPNVNEALSSFALS